MGSNRGIRIECELPPTVTRRQQYARSSGGQQLTVGVSRISQADRTGLVVFLPRFFDSFSAQMITRLPQPSRDARRGLIPCPRFGRQITAEKHKV